ncbi:CASP-like protein 4D1 [Prosopis cineraria]|uniref:CASP-like protein 4D1 n=1 Tax=Prosopis cineraria TaxID=364024 RepID=UPI002410483E|nr:CASP-like protein 4D1 [Prosopis cineraria]
MEGSSSVPPSSSTISRTALLVLRVLTFVFLLIALILISINKGTEQVNGDHYKIKFNDLRTYRYMIATIVIGFAYNLFQMALSTFNVVSGKRLISGDFGYLLDFYGDKMTSYLLATGAAAGFGATMDVHSAFSDLIGLPFDSFFEKANASASLLFIGFLFTATASVFTSYALPKKP